MSAFYNKQTNMESAIKEVAMYLRKSRGDLEEDLTKHETVMIDICKQNGWRFVKYSEIGSGDSIADRPKMIELLRDIELGIYDGCIVFDYDRLGRGSGGDQETIMRTFRNSKTLIIQCSPYQIFNPTNENDEQWIEFKGFLARQEYKMIVKRLVNGKKIGVRLGNWSNGAAPYGYRYESSLKSLVPHEKNSKFYRLIVNKYLREGKSMRKIAYELNEMNIPSPRGGKWSDITIQRILTNEVYLGKIISNKSEGVSKAQNKSGNKKPFAKKPKDEWIIIENCHTPLLSQDEHDEILLEIKKRRTTAPATVSSKNPLSGLVKCGVCGKTLDMQKRKDNSYAIRECCRKDYSDCPNKGGDSKIILTEILFQIKRLKSIIETTQLNLDEDDDSKIKCDIDLLENEKKQKEKAIDRIHIAFESGAYDVEIYKDRLKKARDEISKIDDEIKLLNRKLNNDDKNGRESKLDTINCLIDRMRDGNMENLNKLLRIIVNRIEWTRLNNDEVIIKIEFI